MNNLKVAETIISREYPNGMDATQVDQFKTSFVCFILGYFLIACSNANHGAKDFWGSLLTPNEIPSYNFCSAAIDEIMNAARKAQNELKTKKSIKYVSSCPLLLQVKSFRNRKQNVRNEAATKYNFATVTMNKPPFIPYQGTSKPAAVQTTSHAKRPLNIFLDSYVQGTTPKKLSIPQIIDLRWHSARIIRHMNEFKSIAQPICNNQALSTSATDNLSAKIDNLLEIILNDNLELAKRLHEHVPAVEVRSEGPPKCINNLKCSGSEYSGADSNSDCTSKKIDSSKSKMFQIAVSGDMDATRTPTNALETPCSNTYRDFENVQTPRNELSPATVASRMSETAVAFRLFQREDILNLNARALEAEFTDSPIEKIKVSNGQLASNHVLVGTTMLQKSSAMLATFSNWVLHSKQEENEVCWIINYEPRRLVQLEMLIYGTSKKQRCRHIMESDFAMMVLGNENVMSSRSILDQFRKIAVFYDISECRTIIVPALVNVTWCSYFFDMMLKCVHVADPTYVRSNEIELKKMHDSNVKKILCAMTKVVKELYSGWEVDFTTWDTNYLKPIIHGFSNTEMFDNDDSGLVTIISIRDFHGDTIIESHTQETIMPFKPLLLYELMSIKGNHGTVPTSYIETIDD
ncbi:hypothetical protein CFC21_082918 [Triticum aestivum]|uniref:Uncharacterized protein n=2 Tax=Triticum aestivum TaxID=4565 RepID=A0A3B6NN52_WHEAT|nr:hypothetical protein CFC21_082918 [Triticum aestivum]